MKRLGLFLRSMILGIVRAPLALFSLLVLIPLAAFAQAAAIPTDDPAGLLKLIFDTAAGHAPGKAYLLASLVVILLVFALRKIPFVSDKIPFLKTDRGGVVLTAIVAFAGAVGTALLTGKPMTLDVLWASIPVLVSALGGFVGIKKLFFPSDAEPSPEA